MMRHLPSECPEHITFKILTNKFRPMRYLVQWHIQGILDVILPVWELELSALITEKNNARERSRNADTLIRKT